NILSKKQGVNTRKKDVKGQRPLTHLFPPLFIHFSGLDLTTNSYPNIACRLPSPREFLSLPQ
ncbi:MAG: hypothetical protein NTZ52_01995, partial [Chlamydiae bacterium]|nr:hypothetical protein [Chlamydiota bacterium]